jgi:hypothetical protein
MSSPMTRSMLREQVEDEQARAAYPARPARCDYRLRPAGATYTRSCKRAAGPSGFCWQHADKEEVQS